MYGERHYNAGVLMNGVAKLNALFAGKLSAKPIDDGFYSAPVTANHIVKSDEVRVLSFFNCYYYYV